MKEDPKVCCSRLRNEWALYKIIKTVIPVTSGMNFKAKWMKYFAQGLTKRDEDKPNPDKYAFSKFTRIKQFIFLICIPMVIQSYLQIFDQIGTVNSQSLIYASLKQIQYNLTDVPELMPVHFFSMITAFEVHELMACKIQFNQEACNEITLKKCLAQEPTSLTYENCMIALIKTANAQSE